MRNVSVAPKEFVNLLWVVVTLMETFHARRTGDDAPAGSVDQWKLTFEKDWNNQPMIVVRRGQNPNTHIDWEGGDSVGWCVPPVYDADGGIVHLNYTLGEGWSLDDFVKCINYLLLLALVPTGRLRSHTGRSGSSMLGGPFIGFKLEVLPPTPPPASK